MAGLEPTHQCCLPTTKSLPLRSTLSRCRSGRKEERSPKGFDTSAVFETAAVANHRLALPCSWFPTFLRRPEGFISTKSTKRKVRESNPQGLATRLGSSQVPSPFGLTFRVGHASNRLGFGFHSGWRSLCPAVIRPAQRLRLNAASTRSHVIHR